MTGEINKFLTIHLFPRPTPKPLGLLWQFSPSVSGTSAARACMEEPIQGGTFLHQGTKVKTKGL